MADDKDTEYEAPRLTTYGSLIEITAAGQTRPGSDSQFNGSVLAPGLD